MYEDIENFQELKQYMEEKLDTYNEQPGGITLNLVLFRDAIQHVCRIVRVMRQPCGHMMLVGIGGSGRQSLARLSAYVMSYETFEIEVSCDYSNEEFREGIPSILIIVVLHLSTLFISDIRRLYYKAGVENKPVVFVFSDTDVMMESFLEDINNILSSGEVPNLYFKQEDFEEV